MLTPLLAYGAKRYCLHLTTEVGRLCELIAWQGHSTLHAQQRFIIELHYRKPAALYAAYIEIEAMDK
jgi:hypothetical protein